MMAPPQWVAMMIVAAITSLSIGFSLGRAYHPTPCVCEQVSP